MKSTYEERSLDFGPGDRIYFYSDGIPEARDTEDEQWGNERLAAKLDELLATDLDDGSPVSSRPFAPGRAAPLR